MKFFITLSKRHLAVILGVIVLAIAISGWSLSEKSNLINGSTNALRIDYIRSLRLEPDDRDVESKEIIIPQSFGEVYEEYNKLQKKAGFDLKNYKGRKATLYTYSLSGTDKKLHLIVLNGYIIGGDIADIEVEGEMLPLKHF